MAITSLYAAIAALGLIYLSYRVIRLRWSERVSVGHQGNAALERAMRVHGNFVEYVPFALLLLALAEIQGLPPLFVHLLGLALLASRVSHFLGFRTPEAPGRLRVIGMGATFTVIGTTAITLLGLALI